jgi:hypothetical protein
MARMKLFKSMLELRLAAKELGVLVAGVFELRAETRVGLLMWFLKESGKKGDTVTFYDGVCLTLWRRLRKVQRNGERRAPFFSKSGWRFRLE